MKGDTHFTDGELKLRLSNLLKVSRGINILFWIRDKNYTASALSICAVCFPPAHCHTPKPPPFSSARALSLCLVFQHVIDVFAYNSGSRLK